MLHAAVVHVMTIISLFFHSSTSPWRTLSTITDPSRYIVNGNRASLAHDLTTFLLEVRGLARIFRALILGVGTLGVRILGAGMKGWGY